MASPEKEQKSKESREKKDKSSKESKEKKDNEKDKWRVKTLEEIMEEKRKRKEQHKVSGESGSRLEEGELYPEKSKSRSPGRERRESEESEEKVEEEFDALQIQPPQATSKKDTKSYRKEEKKKHSHRSNRDRERRHKRKRSHSKEKREHSRLRLEHAKEQRREKREERHEEPPQPQPQPRSVSHDRGQQREQLVRDQTQRESERHWREREQREQVQREQSRKDRDRLERLERDRERERDHKKRSERSREQERYRGEKVPGKDRRRERRGGRDEEQWRRREESRHDSREYARHEKRWVERDRSPPLRDNSQPRPLMEIKVDRPKARSPSAKHDYEGSARGRDQPIPPPVPLMELKVERPPGKKRSPGSTKQSKNVEDKSIEKQRRREEKRERKQRKVELLEEEHPKEQVEQIDLTDLTAEHESSDSDESSSDDSEESSDSGDDSEVKSGSEASSDDSDSDDDSEEESEEEEEEEEAHAQEVTEKKEEGERATSEDESDTDSDSDTDSESGKGSESESEKSDKEEEAQKNSEEKEAKPRVDNHEKKGDNYIRKANSYEKKGDKYDARKSRSPDVAVHRPQKSKFDRDSTPSGHEDNATQSSDEDYLPDSPPQSPIEFKEELPPYLPAISGCRSVEEFVCLNKIEEGTYGVVYRAKEKRNDEIVALKRLKMEKEKEGFPITSLREINTLLKAQHVNIVTVREIVVGSNMDKIYIVMDYVEHDLKSLMETMKQPFTIGEVKCLMLQLLRGVRHLHDNWILHRDLKTSNLLLSHRGVLKIGDFGLAREYGSPLKMYTPIVVTLWYRAPELLLGSKEYACPIDMWSVGCIFAEFITMKALFPGRSEVDQLNRIFKELGTPSEKIWPGYSELPAVKKMTFAEHPYNNLRNRFGAILTDQGFELMNKFLTYNPSKRITADESVHDPYFKESPLPIQESMFPTWPAKSEMTRTSKKEKSPRPPEGGLQYANLEAEEEGFKMTLPSQGTSVKTIGFSLRF